MLRPMEDVQGVSDVFCCEDACCWANSSAMADALKIRERSLPGASRRESAIYHIDTFSFTDNKNKLIFTSLKIQPE